MLCDQELKCETLTFRRRIFTTHIFLLSGSASQMTPQKIYCESDVAFEEFDSPSGLLFDDGVGVDFLTLNQSKNVRGTNVVPSILIQQLWTSQLFRFNLLDQFHKKFFIPQRKTALLVLLQKRGYVFFCFFKVDHLEF
jgi:hypothetical protein